ncbi:aspartate aminotransferase family protein [Janibacter melonis]|uniref:hypothetical protein n=1 Tax=Janibacter melonis TaxID=262209 RepID=UPI00174AF5F4|nr:hypothetical protein [Janibacter melonis]
MLEPFEAVIDFTFYEMTWDLQPGPEELSRIGAGESVLICDYFGRSVPSSTSLAIEEARSRGVVVLSDTTHSPFTPPTWSFDLAIISLRKTLPIHDGAILVGALAHPPPEFEAVDESRIAAREAMAARKASLVAAGTDSGDEAAGLRDFENYLQTLDKPTAMSRKSRSIIDALNFEIIANRRRANADELLNRVEQINAVRALPDYSRTIVPAFITCQVSDARTVQQALSKQGIFCPVHWPRPDQLAATPWRNDLISLPIDHRYDRDDMVRISSALQHHLEDA